VDLAPDLKDLLEEFARDAVELVLVGGYAVAYHGRPRATKDIDFVLVGTSANLERAARALERFGAPASVVEAVLTMAVDDVVFMGQPPLRVDFLRTIDGVATADLFARSVAGELDGVPVRVISIDDLIENKRTVGRKQDKLDVEFLEQVRAKRQ
jgi:predicted nucleotidyltransferase